MDQPIYGSQPKDKTCKIRKQECADFVLIIDNEK
jgi:hypothetical protein